MRPQHLVSHSFAVLMLLLGLTACGVRSQAPTSTVKGYGHSDVFDSAASCRALITHQLPLCDTQDCRSILGQAPGRCWTGDCRAMTLSQVALCGSGDCRAVLTNTVSLCTTCVCQAMVMQNPALCSGVNFN